MPSNYNFNPRGIIKWHAFAAVISGSEQFNAAIEDEILEFELLDDQIEKINTNILLALEHNSIVIIDYLFNNVFQRITGCITKFSKNEDYLVCLDFIIPLESIRNITLID